MNRERYLPEGYQSCLQPDLTWEELRCLMDSGAVLEGRVLRCDRARDLHLRFAGYMAMIPREEVNSPLLSGSEKEIAVLSRVGHTVSFVITGMDDTTGTLTLSRRIAQERALTDLLENCPTGTILPGRVRRLERFGAFVDIGCGVTALLPLELISIAHLGHPKERLRPGQNLLCIVKYIDEKELRFTVSHQELLGTWEENAALFSPGEVVTGMVRGVKDYGIFVELRPNLSGLADLQEGIEVGDAVSVLIRSIQPERMKVKLQIIERLDTPLPAEEISYYITEGRITHWRYAPLSCQRDFGSVTFS